MANSDQFELGAMYDFTTYAPTVLGTFRNVRAVGVVDHNGAQQYIDPAAAHANVYGSLPANSAPDDHTRYFYLVVTQTNGLRTAIGLPWIDGSSVQLKERGRAIVTLEDFGPEDMSRLRMALASNNFTVGNIELDN